MFSGTLHQPAFTMLCKISRLSALLGIASTAHAATLTVSTAPGNATSPILYGLLYEVCIENSQLEVFKLIAVRMSITLVTEVCTRN